MTYTTTAAIGERECTIIIIILPVHCDPVYWQNYYNNFASTLDRFRAEELVFTNPVSGVTIVYPQNTDTDIPRAVLGDPNQNLRASDRFIENGSYLRLKSLTIGYTLPQSLSERLKTDKLRIYA